MVSLGLEYLNNYLFVKQTDFCFLCQLFFSNNLKRIEQMDLFKVLKQGSLPQRKIVVDLFTASHIYLLENPFS